MSENKSVQEGMFFVYIKADEVNKVKYSENEYTRNRILPKLNNDTINNILSGNNSIKFVGITADQQLYKPHKDANILVSALNHPNCKVKLTFRRNGAVWFDDIAELSTAGLLLYTISDLDLGKYDVSGEVLLDSEAIGIGTTSFDVAVFELDPFQVIIESQSMSQSQQLTANVDVTILHIPYSGPLKVGLFCSYCREIVLRDEVTVTNGKAIVSFNVSGHTAPFSLEFIVPERGYTAMIQLEGTMPHQRVPTPISANLKQNYQMSLFPQTGSINVQGVNITPSEVNNDSFFEVDGLVGNTINFTISQDTDLVSLTIYNPITQEIRHFDRVSVKAGDALSIEIEESHVIVFFAGIKSTLLYEGFFAAFKSTDSLVTIDVPTEVQAGGSLKLSVNNLSLKNEAEIFVLVFDKRKTHSSLYKAIGERVHSHLKGGLQYLPSQIQSNFEQRRYLFDDEYRKLKQEEDARSLRDEMMMEAEEEMMGMDDAPKMMMKSSKKGGRGMKLKAKMAPPSPKRAMPSSLGAPAPSPVAGPPADSEPTSSEELPTDLFEDFEEVLFVDTFNLASKEIKTIEIELADQITTWEVRLYGFQGLQFNEVVKNVSAVKTKFIQIRAPDIIDAENGDTSEIEVHYLTEIPGTIEVFLDDNPIIPKKDIESGDGVLMTSLNIKGVIHAVLETAQYNLEAVKQVHLPFEQSLIFTHMVHLYPGEPFNPPQEVQIFPNPLPLIRESVHALQGYPFGCAEQTSAKLGALAMAYKYHKSINSGEEVALLGMIKQGIGRLFTEFYNNSGKRFGLWSQESTDERTTIQVLRNLSPLFPILDDLQLSNYKNMLSDASSILIKSKIKSFELGVYSPNLLPDREVKDPLEAAWALLSSDLSNKEKYLEVIQKSANLTEEACKWESPLAWAGVLQATATLLRGLVKHEAELSEDIKKLYQKGFNYVMSNMINGRLFSTTDTLALIGLFTEIPRGDTKIKIDGDVKEITESFKISNEFIAQSNVYVHWIEEKIANPFADLPSLSTKLKIDVDKTKCRVGDELKLTIYTPSDLLCPVAAICLPPHIAMMKGGGNIQQHYLPFREDKSILLELACVRKGTGHIRVIVHDMYNMEQVVKTLPLVITAK